MKVFISWSKEPSRQLALILRDWLPEVIQAIQPWVSSEDISKGERWRAVLSITLSEVTQGIICVTPQSLAAPWLNFEAGALAKSIDSARVRTVLLGVEPHEVTGPLAEFQATNVRDEPDMYKFVQSLNEPEVTSLNEDRLERAFGRAWPDLAEKVDQLDISATDEGEIKRSPESLLVEVLERMRVLEKKVLVADDQLREWLLARENKPTLLDAAIRMVRNFYSDGDVVRHKTFGVGRILEADASTGVAYVEFGDKPSLTKYVPIDDLLQARPDEVEHSRVKERARSDTSEDDT